MRRGSFASAARALEIAPSSVSRTIATLEDELGVRLFNRTTRNLSPTDPAIAYFERIEPAVQELEQAALVATDSDETPRGLIRVTAAVSFAQVNLIPLLPEFSRRHPKVQFELILTDRLSDLVEDRIDLAVRLGRLADSSLVAHRLCDMVHVTCASPDYVRRRGRPETPEDLARHDCLRHPLQGYRGWRFRRPGGEPVEVAVSGHVVANHGAALVACATAGMGIVTMPRWLVADALRSGALVQVLTDYEVTVSEFDVAAWIVYPSRSHLPWKVRVFADFLKREFRGGAPGERGLGALTKPARSGRR